VARIGRVVFLGAGRFGAPLLRRLPEISDELLVVSVQDRPAGRGLDSRPAPIAAEARALRLPLVQPARIRSAEGRRALEDFRPDGLLLASYGQLVPDDVLQLAPRPPLNVHPSLLPRHRGAAPVAGTILAGDEEAGVTLMIMTPELDAGPIVAQWGVPLEGSEQSPELESRLAELAAERVPPVLQDWADGRLEPRPQDTSRATTVRAFRRADGWIDWQRSAFEIDRRVRALQPWPGAWTTLDGRRVHVRRAHPEAGAPPVGPGTLLPGDPVRVATGGGVLVLDQVQPEGRPVMPAEAWRLGLPRQHVRLGTEAPPG
jgi:methionyl-tRNA formyltransferase